MPILTPRFLARVQEVGPKPNNLQFEFGLMMEKVKANPHCLLPLLHEGKFSDVVLQEPLTPLAKHLIYALQANTRLEPYLVGLSDPLGLIPVIYGIKFGDMDYQNLLSTWLESGLTRLPQPLAYAIEREDLMKELFKPQDIPIHIIQGTGGVGKTQFAMAYANTHIQGKNFVRWMHADKHNFRQEWLRTGELLGLDLKGKPKETQDKSIQLALRKHKSWLIILDDVENQSALEGLLPNPLLPTQQVLITTRSQLWGNYPTLALPPFTPEECQTYMEKRLKPEQCVGSQELAQRLGYMPLALAHAVAYIKQSDKTVQTYLDLYKEKGIKLLNKPDVKSEADDANYQETVLTTYQLSIAELSVKNPKAAELVKYCAYLRPENIDQLFLKKLLNIDGDEEMDGCIRDIRRYSLLSRSKTGFDMNPLVQDAIRYHERDVVFATRLEPIINKLRHTIQVQSKDPIKTRELESHFQTVVGHLQSFVEQKDTIPIEKEAADKILAEIAEERDEKTECAPAIPSEAAEAVDIAVAHFYSNDSDEDEFLYKSPPVVTEHAYAQLLATSSSAAANGSIARSSRDNRAGNQMRYMQGQNRNSFFLAPSLTAPVVSQRLFAIDQKEESASHEPAREVIHQI